VTLDLRPDRGFQKFLPKISSRIRNIDASEIPLNWKDTRAIIWVILEFRTVDEGGI
jgi:hypothetical protein